MKRAAWLLAVVALPSLARAGGFEFPENTTEALGRGGAFVAKADNPSAVYFNVAGLARQRGTKLQLDVNIVLHDRTFTRAGNYPGDPTDPATPWAGQPYPTISNQGPPQIAPFFAISTDFGKLDRWNFAFGIFGPSSYGKRSYPTTVTVNGNPNAPSPARYDVLNADLLVIYPTLAAAVRVTKWFDLGLALHLVVGHFDLSNTVFADLGSSACPVPEYPRCDALNHIVTTGFTATASLGMKFTPVPALQIGVNLRGPADIVSTGKLDATPPAANPLIIPQTDVRFSNKLPWALRLGIRYAFLKEGFEQGDIEVDGTYEAWHDAQADGAKIHIDDLFPKGEVDTIVTHNYRDTFGVRLGGAYNARLPKGVLTVRLGFAFDSAATTLPYTRLDFDTGARYIPTVGLGYKVRGVAINIGYAYMFSPDRTVTNGVIPPINPFGVCPRGNPDCGIAATSNDARGNPLGPINNGTYTASNMTFSAGITIDWDEALKKTRILKYE